MCAQPADVVDAKLTVPVGLVALRTGVMSRVRIRFCLARFDSTCLQQPMIGRGGAWSGGH